MVPSPVATFLGNLTNTGAKPILSYAYIYRHNNKWYEMILYSVLYSYRIGNIYNVRHYSKTPALQNDPMQCHTQ